MNDEEPIWTDSYLNKYARKMFYNGLGMGLSLSAILISVATLVFLNTKPKKVENLQAERATDSIDLSTIIQIRKVHHTTNNVDGTKTEIEQYEGVVKDNNGQYHFVPFSGEAIEQGKEIEKLIEGSKK